MTAQEKFSSPAGLPPQCALYEPEKAAIFNESMTAGPAETAATVAASRFGIPAKVAER